MKAIIIGLVLFGTSGAYADQLCVFMAGSTKYTISVVGNVVGTSFYRGPGGDECKYDYRTSLKEDRGRRFTEFVVSVGRKEVKLLDYF